MRRRTKRPIAGQTDSRHFTFSKSDQPTRGGSARQRTVRSTSGRRGIFYFWNSGLGRWIWAVPTGAPWARRWGALARFSPTDRSYDIDFLVSTLGLQLLISHITTPGRSSLSKPKHMPEPGPVYNVMFNTWRSLETRQGNGMTHVMYLLLSCICDCELGNTKGALQKLAELNRL